MKSIQEVPPAPWQLRGSAVLLLRDWRSALALVHYTDSPVGPYDELAVSTLTARGPSVVQMWVTSEDSRHGGRANWGFPKELGDLQWRQRGRHVTFRAGRRYWRVRAGRPSFTLRMKLWSVQVLNGQAVRVPFKIAGRARLAWRGRQLALLLEDFDLTVLPPELI